MCGLVYERNPGDTWAFTVIGDRLPVAAIIVLLYFGFGRYHHTAGYVVFAVLGALLVWTAPNRWGVGIALHYLSRRFWPDPADPIPSRKGIRTPVVKAAPGALSCSRCRWRCSPRPARARRRHPPAR